MREAVPRPPLTMARPRKPVLTSTAVFPDATLCINQLMSDAVRSRTSRDPNSGRMWRVIRPRSTYSVEAFRPIALAQDQPVLSSVKVSAAQLSHRDCAPVFRPFGCGVATLSHIRQRALGQGARFVYRQDAEFSEREAAADAAGKCVRLLA